MINSILLVVDGISVVPIDVVDGSSVVAIDVKVNDDVEMRVKVGNGVE